MGSHDPADRILRMTHQESALLYNLLSDNAKGWNAELRRQLGQVVTATEAHNAKNPVSAARKFRHYWKSRTKRHMTR